MACSSISTRLVAATAYAWNAYVAERLFLGHWTLLVAYACLPWIVAAGLRVRREEPGGWPALVLACAPAVLVPTGGVLAAGAAVAAAGLRKAPWTVALAVGLNAPWWLPGMLHGNAGASDPAAVDAFAARSEGPGGAVVSVLGLGGIWNGDAVPAGRGGVLVPLVALLLVAGGGYGLRRLAGVWGRAPVVDRATRRVKLSGPRLTGPPVLGGGRGTMCPPPRRADDERRVHRQIQSAQAPEHARRAQLHRAAAGPRRPPRSSP